MVFDAPSLGVDIGLTDRQVRLNVFTPTYDGPRLTPAQRNRRAVLNEEVAKLRSAVSDLRAWVPASYRVSVRPVPTRGTHPTADAAWPRLALGDPADVGVPAGSDGRRCAVLAAGAPGLAEIVDAARRTTFASDWDDGAGGRVQVWVRPLLPGDRGC